MRPAGDFMIISLIAVMDENRVIGKDNRMPWRLPMDRTRFHAITRGHPVIMGRRTFESIGRPLSARTNIILTRQPAFHVSGGVVVPSLADALRAAAGADEAFILGGQDVFQQSIDFAHKIYLTIVHTKSAGDSFFPEIPAVFVEISREEAMDSYPVTFLLYDRAAASMS